MAATESTPPPAPTRPRAKVKPQLSPDGKWKSFGKVPHLLQYMPTKGYYARVRVGGKLVRRSLKTRVYSNALLRLHDFVKQHRATPPRTNLAPVTFAEARQRFEDQLAARHDLKPRAKEYRQGCIKVLLKTWPELENMQLSRITSSTCSAWAKRFLDQGYDDHYFNQTLSTLKHILDCGELNPNPAASVRRRGVKLKELKLPEPDQFQQLLDNMDRGGGGYSRHAADLVRFLAFSGCRLSEARGVTWADVDLKRGRLLVENAKQRLTSLSVKKRQVPIIPDMRELLERLKKSNPRSEQSVCRVHECQRSLTRACRELRIPRLTHHDLRHLFATRCIESGVDVPTVSRWLGHRDGGALAMKVYGHLRDLHSTEMASKVTFAVAEQKT